MKKIILVCTAGMSTSHSVDSGTLNGAKVLAGAMAEIKGREG